MRADFVIECKAAVTMAGKGGGLIKDAAIAIRGSRIAWIGRREDLPGDVFAARRMRRPDLVAMPGLVNTHCHAAMVLLRGFGDDLALQEWLERKVFPAEANLTADNVYWGTLLASIEMIKSGCTAFADMYYFMDSAAQAVADIGIRAALARSVSSTTDENLEKLAESLDFCLRWNGVADGRITAMMSPHSLYTCSPEYVGKLARMAQDHGLRIQTHLAETKREEQYALDRYGMTTASKMSEIGLFDCEVLAAHCVWLTDSDMDVLAAKGVKVAHNPGSNTKIASGIARVTEMRKRGITVGIGTDGACTNNNLDMVEEMRLASMLAKVSTLDPMALPAEEALAMATSAGADCLGGGGEYGRLEPGMKADVVLLDTTGAHMVPEHDIVSNIAYSASGRDVRSVFIDGRLVMEEGRVLTVDEEAVKEQCSRRAADLVRGLN